MEVKKIPGTGISNPGTEKKILGAGISNPGTGKKSWGPGFKIPALETVYIIEKIFRALRAPLPAPYETLKVGCPWGVLFFFFQKKLNSRNVYIWQHFDPQNTPKCVYMVAF